MPELIRDATESIGATSTEISQRLVSGQRTLITFVNTSATQVISLRLNDPAVAGTGITLYPRQPYSESIDSRFIPSNLSWNAVADGAGGTLAVHERVQP